MASVGHTEIMNRFGSAIISILILSCSCATHNVQYPILIDNISFTLDLPTVPVEHGSIIEVTNIITNIGDQSIYIGRSVYWKIFSESGSHSLPISSRITPHPTCAQAEILKPGDSMSWQENVHINWTCEYPDSLKQLPTIPCNGNVEIFGEVQVYWMNSAGKGWSKASSIVSKPSYLEVFR